MVIRLVALAFQVFYYLLLARVIFSFVRLGRDANPTLLRVRALVYSVTEPVLAPIRRVVPPVHLGGGGYLDLSALIVFILLPHLQRLIIGLLIRIL